MVQVRIRCRHCGFETNIDIFPSPMIGKPGKDAKGLKLKYSREDYERIMENAHGASMEDLAEIGIEISKEEFLDAEERIKVKEFLRKNLKISKDMRRASGEMIKLGTDNWKMGDKFSDIDLPASEVASMGDEDLRLIPGVTMKKSTYMEAPGHEKEVLRGVKFVTLLDTSGSMFDNQGVKIKKALTLCEESWRICRKLDFDYFLASFSDGSKIVPRDKQEDFFTNLKYRAQFMFSGGTQLNSGLTVFTDDIYKDCNLMIISDMDISDIASTVHRLQEIAKITNSFRIILISPDRAEDHQKRIKSWFPDENVDIIIFQV